MANKSIMKISSGKSLNKSRTSVRFSLQKENINIDQSSDISVHRREVVLQEKPLPSQVQSAHKRKQNNLRLSSKIVDKSPIINPEDCFIDSVSKAQKAEEISEVTPDRRKQNDRGNIRKRILLGNSDSAKKKHKQSEKHVTNNSKNCLNHWFDDESDNNDNHIINSAVKRFILDDDANAADQENIDKNKRVSSVSHNATAGSSVRLSADLVEETPDVFPNPQILSFSSRTRTTFSDQSGRNTEFPDVTPKHQSSKHTLPRTSGISSDVRPPTVAKVSTIPERPSCSKQNISQSSARRSIFPNDESDSSSDEVDAVPLNDEECNRNHCSDHSFVSSNPQKADLSALRLCDTQPMPTNVLEGVVAYVEVRTGGDNRSAGIRAYLADLGATVSQKLTKQVTHVVFKEGLMSTYKKAKEWNIPIVSVLWIEECKKRGIQVSERLFPPPDVEQYDSPDPLRKLKRIKSFQPDIENTKKIYRRKNKDIKVIEDNANSEENFPDTSAILKRVLGAKWDKKSSNGMINALKSVADLDETEISVQSQLSDEEPFKPLAFRLLEKLQLEESANSSGNMGKSPRVSRDSEVEGIVPLKSPRTRNRENKRKSDGSSNDIPSRDDIKKTSRNTTSDKKLGTKHDSPEQSTSGNVHVKAKRELTSTAKSSVGVPKKKAGNSSDENEACNTRIKKIQENSSARRAEKDVSEEKDSAVRKTDCNSMKPNSAATETDCNSMKPNSAARKTDSNSKKSVDSSTDIFSTSVATRSSRRLASVPKNDTLTVNESHHVYAVVNVKPGTSSGKTRNNSEKKLLNLSEIKDMDTVPINFENSVDDEKLPDKNKVNSSSETVDNTSSQETHFSSDGTLIVNKDQPGTSSMIDSSQLSQGKKRKLMPMRQPSSPLPFINVASIIEARNDDSNRVIKKKRITKNETNHEVLEMDLTNPVPSSSKIETNVPSSTKNSDRRKTSTSRQSSKSRKSSNQFVTLEKEKSAKPLPTIVCTSLHRHEVETVIAIIVKLKGYLMENKVSSRTTHVVASGPKRTMNLLKGIARGCWIVKQEWVLRSLEAGKWLEEEEYEITDFSPAVQEARIEKQSYGPAFKLDLFGSCNPIFVDPSSTPPAEDLRELIELCGGTLVNYRSAKIIVGRTAYRKDITCVREQWVLDSVSSNSLKPLDRYRLRNRK